MLEGSLTAPLMLTFQTGTVHKQHMQGQHGILELRKEKSRDAARSRRGKENYEFYELAKLLPLPCAITSQLDKASIIRLAISYLKLRDFSSHGDPPWNRDGPPPNKSVQAGPNRRRSVAAVAAEIFETHQGTHILQSLDGFAFAVSTDGRFLYISETVSIYLGLSQVEMTGSSVFEYIHPEDHAELAEKLGLCLPQPSPSGGSSGSGDDNNSTSSGGVHIPGPPAPERAFMNTAGKGHELDRAFCIRMKSTLTKRGVHVKSSGYRVVLILTQVRAQFSFSLSRKHPPPLLGLVSLAIALPPPTIHEVLIDNDCFVMRFSPELKVLYCEQRVSDLMDLSAEDLTNSSLYTYCHAADLQKLKKAHTDLTSKGQVLSDYYRLMNKHGGYVWIQTCATIICHAKNADEQNIIAINYVISGIEYGGCVMNTDQMKHVSRTEPDQSDHSESDTASEQGDRRGSKSPGGLGSPGNSQLKRKHSPTLDDNGYDSMALQEPKLHCKDDTYDSYSEDFNCKPGEKRDLKNSRRKMDKPRKRSRLDSGSDPEMNVGHSHSDNNNVRESEELEAIMDEEERHDNNQPSNAVDLTSVPIHSSPPEALSLVKSPAPEDLSVRTSQSTILQSSGSHISNVSNEKWSTNVGTDNSVGLPVTNSTVRDLEEIMNKHLPVLPGNADSRQGYPADYDSSLNSANINFPQKHRSTIQWIGSQHPSHEHLPASTLLRTLYANRESVIRSNVYKCSQSYPEAGVQNNLLTPPGSDHSQVATTKSPPVSASYVPVPITVSMATNQNETYSMTPPSSVSPHEKYQSNYPDQSYQESVMRQCGADLSASHGMPIKPQAYPLPAHTNSHLAMYGRAGVPYGATDYYSSSTPFSGYPALGSGHATYTDAQKNATSW